MDVDGLAWGFRRLSTWAFPPTSLPPFVPLSLLSAIFSCCCPAAERCVVVALCVRAFAACIYVMCML